ncbi:cyclohexanone monooxygenase [Hyaloscypha finlandica]|nr:cyclohexanone monooxygenase [Hyaloscypha finlandica]
MAATLTNGATHVNGNSKELEVLVVGMGFGGIYLLQNLRKLGYNVKAVEAGGGLGGIWWWNSYPGARVDTSLPFYELSDEALWKDWTWSERFPAQAELQEYFQHVDKVYNLSKDVQFNTTVTSAKFNQETNKWYVSTDKGETITCRYLILATGFAAKEHIPNIQGIETFKGPAFHTAKTPKGKDAIEFQEKSIAVIKTGASRVQVIQELSLIADHLTVFQRTPNLALPMRQRKLDKEDKSGEQRREKREYKYLLELRKRTVARWDYSYNPKKAMERDKVRQRITKTELCDDLCPDVAPVGSPFRTKRPSLEQIFYEVVQQPNVELVNLKKKPILEITPTGILVADDAGGKTREIPLDIIILATRFDASGSLTKIDIHGTRTQLGLATAGFPNLLFLYGPQSPGAFAIGPAAAEIQGDWIINCLEDLKRAGHTRIEALARAEEKWARLVNEQMDMTLISKSSSWYVGANIPGKVREATNYIGGLPSYTKAIYECTDNGYEGFVLT